MSGILKTNIIKNTLETIAFNVAELLDSVKNQVIGGSKEFTNPIIVPNAVNTNEAVNKGQLDTKAPLASPSLTGTPIAPTATSGTNTTQIATTAFVKTAVDAIPIIPTASTTVQGKIELATNAEVLAGTDTVRAVTPAGLKAGINATGSAPIYACRAWANCANGGTIRASGNFSSIADGGVGLFTANMTTAMPDVNYAPLATAGGGYSNISAKCAITSVTSFSIVTGYEDGEAITADPSYIFVAVFR